MGRVLVKMYLDETTVAAIDELAERESRSRSGMLGVIVKNWLWLDQQEPADSGQREPEIVSAGPLAGKPRPRKRDDAPAAPVDTPAEGPPAGSTNAPGKPHRHRYVTEVPGSRQGRAGVIQADFACACGEVKRQAVR